jgi:hypothetical protein
MGRPKGSKNKKLFLPEEKDRNGLAVRYMRIKKRLQKTIDQLQRDFDFSVTVVAVGRLHDRTIEHWPDCVDQLKRDMIRKLLTTPTPPSAETLAPATLQIQVPPSSSHQNGNGNGSGLTSDDEDSTL